MRRADRMVLLVLPSLALLAAFGFLLLAPKREEAAELGDEVTELEASVAEQEELAGAAERARREFPRSYRRVVVLGKAVPEDEDTSSFLLQLGRIGDRTSVEFDSLALAQTESGASPAPAAPAPQTPATAAEAQEQRVETAESGNVPAPPVPAPATEATAASLPIGASIGPAGLGVMPYDLQFRGGYSGIADFVRGLDKQVGIRENGRARVAGRLLTVDGFSLSPEEGTGEGPPNLNAFFAVTTYVTPANQGMTAGATPAGPAPAATAAPPAAAPASGAPKPAAPSAPAATASAPTGTPP